MGQKGFYIFNNLKLNYLFNLMNLDDFFLSENDKKNIKGWLKTFDKPLFISGKTGIGKSLLMNTILKDYNIIEIDQNLNSNIIEYINKTIYDQDISMMFQTKKNIKGVLFDNIFHTDRVIISFFKKLVSKSSKNPKIPYIIITNDLINKQIQNISSKCIHIYLKYNIVQYKSIIYKKYGQKNKQISDELINDSNYNFHTIQSNIDFYDTTYKNSYIDSYENDINVLTNKLNHDYTIEEMSRNYSCDYNTVSLNLIDDISKQDNIKNILQIYESFIIYDNYEMFRNRYCIYDTTLSIFYSICFPYLIIKKNKLKLSENIKYNSYMSKSFIYTHLNDLDDKNKYYVYFYYIKHLLNIDKNDVIFNTFNDNCNKKIFNNYIKLYELIYDKTICKNKIKIFNNLI